MRNLFKPKQVLLAFAMVLVPTLIYAQTQSGTLDATFGTGGEVTTNFGSSAGAGNVAIQPDGKLVVAGTISQNGRTDFAVSRYNTDGTLDAGFGVGGKVTTDFFDGYDVGSGVVIQADGKIVVGGTVGTNPFADFGLARYNSNGTLDTTFGTGGKVNASFFDPISGGHISANAYSLALQPDGKIVQSGEANIKGGNSFGLVRYNSNGTLDPTFGSGGKVTTDFFAPGQTISFAFANSITIQPDGKIIAAGDSGINEAHDFVLARYNSDGTLDPTFGTG